MKRIFFLIFISISILIIYNFGQTIYRLLSKKDLLVQAQNELKKMQRENAGLRKQIVQVQNRHFIEEQARDKLFLVKPGENTIVIPSNALPRLELKKIQNKEKPHWREWIDTFWH